MAKECFRCEWIKCGKAACRSCPHGPYWYAYWSEGGKTKKRYVGKGDPTQAKGEKDRLPETPDRLDAVFSACKITPGLCWEILGLRPGATWDEAKRTFKILSFQHHPDRGGEVKIASRINADFQFLKAFQYAK